MPSLWKHPQSPYWTCCYTNAAGQRCKKSTKQADRAAAMEVCFLIERAERFAKAGTLTEQQVRKILSETLERTTGEKLHDQTVAEWLDQWLAGKTQTRAAGTVERYKQVIRDFQSSLGNRVRLALAAITPKDILNFRDAELAECKAPKTANLSVKIVSAAFNAAFRQGHIQNNPCLAVEPLPEETAERDTFTKEQIAQLVSAAEGDWKAAILFAYYTGARESDVANMQWNAIDLNKKLITFTPRKTRRTKKAITTYLHPELEKELLKNPGIGRAYLFSTLAGKGTGGTRGLSTQFAKIMAAAGIEGKNTRHTAKGRANSSLSFHSLRHTFNSALANAGVSQEVRRKFTGHSSAGMNDIYTHHEIETLRAAIATLPSIGN